MYNRYIIVYYRILPTQFRLRIYVYRDDAIRYIHSYEQVHGLNNQRMCIVAIVITFACMCTLRNFVLICLVVAH